MNVIDFSEEMLNMAKKKNMPDNVSFAVADATKIITGHNFPVTFLVCNKEF